MWHHTATEIDGGWRYAALSSRGGHPLGYCADHEPHPTETEARECFARYQRDNIELTVHTSNWCGCEVCGAPTKTGATIRGDGYAQAMLCADHLTTAHAIEALGLTAAAGDSWES